MLIDLSQSFLGRTSMNRITFKRAGALILSLAITVSLVPKITGKGVVKADDEWVKSAENTEFGTSQIANPVVPASNSSAWQGSYVYYGKYNDEPIRFRVLNKDSNKFGGRTLFLDSDKLLFQEEFDNDYSNVWANSSLREYLNNTFFNDSFSKVEQNAVFASTVDSHEYSSSVQVQDSFYSEYGSYTPLNKDKVFVLDIEDVSNNMYGYHYKDGVIHKKQLLTPKERVDPHWWLRTPKKNTNNVIAYVNQNGTLVTRTLRDYSGQGPDLDISVAPAMNIDKNAIILSSLISGNRGKAGAEYKLTVKDDDINLSIPDGKNVTVDGNTVTVPYVLSGKNAGKVTQLSVVIKDRSTVIRDGKIIESPEIFYYQKLDWDLSKEGKVTFNLPEDFFKYDIWGFTSQMYLLAEDANAKMETDYAGEPLLLPNPNPVVTYDVRTPFDCNFAHMMFLQDLILSDTIGKSETDQIDLDKNGDLDLELKQVSSFDFVLSRLDSCNLRGRFVIDYENAYPQSGIKTVVFILSDFDVSLDKVSNGTATLSKTKALNGDEIKVTVKPDAGYALDKITYTPEGGTAVDITSSKKFTMPKNNVSVKVTFKNQASLTLDKTKADVVCGNSLSLKATLKGADSKVSWKSSNTKIATVDANGKITAKQAGAVTITASAAGKTAKCTVQVLFKDVINTKEFWYEPTYYLANMNVVKGYDNQTLFKPAVECTRAQMLTFMWRLAGCPEPKSSKCDFPDVKSGDYFFKPVIWAVENGITTGYSDKTFKPKNVCSRAQTVTFLWRMAGKPNPKTKENKFKDVKSNAYYYKATLWASEMKILAGYDDGTFRPDGLCLRRQMVTFLYKYDKFVNGKG